MHRCDHVCLVREPKAGQCLGLHVWGYIHSVSCSPVQMNFNCHMYIQYVLGALE